MRIMMSWSGCEPSAEKLTSETRGKYFPPDSEIKIGGLDPETNRSSIIYENSGTHGLLAALDWTTLAMHLLWREHGITGERELLEGSVSEKMFLSRIDALESSMRRAARDLKRTRRFFPSRDIAAVRDMLNNAADHCMTPGSQPWVQGDDGW
mgnify:CR=1 FL=1